LIIDLCFFVPFCGKKESVNRYFMLFASFVFFVLKKYNLYCLNLKGEIMKFPKTESDIATLAELMVAGYTAHAADFPSVTPADLTTALTDYTNQRNSLENAKGQAKIAVVAKEDKLDALVELMRNDLKLSEVDVANDPEKLAEIGWGPRNIPTPILPPGVPTELHPIAESQGAISFAWVRPLDGGPVRNYIVERRQAGEGGVFGSWMTVQSCYNTDASIIEQPVDVRLEYRVKASNAAGESMPSNTVSVMLP
jgi:hypothetical protein